MTRINTPLHEARRQAAKQLGLKPTDPRVVQLSMLLAARDQLQKQLAAGKVVDVAALLKLDEALKAYMPAVESSVSVQLVPMTICARCRSEIEREPDPPPPDPPRLLPPPSGNGADNVDS